MSPHWQVTCYRIYSITTTYCNSKKLIILALYRICCSPSWCPAQFHRGGSPGESRSCSKAAAASESLSDGWGQPGSGTASPRTPGDPAAVRVLPSSVRLPSCSPPHRLGWEQNESQREPERHQRGQSCPKIRWRSSQPRPLPPSQIKTHDPVCRRSKWWAEKASVRENE